MNFVQMSRSLRPRLSIEMLEIAYFPLPMEVYRLLSIFEAPSSQTGNHPGSLAFAKFTW
jgi:hypothetical protein